MFDSFGGREGGIAWVGDGKVDGGLKECGECLCSPCCSHLFGLGDGDFEVGCDCTDDFKRLSAFNVEFLQLGGEEGGDEVVFGLGSGKGSLGSAR